MLYWHYFLFQNPGVKPTFCKLFFLTKKFLFHYNFNAFLLRSVTGGGYQMRYLVVRGGVGFETMKNCVA